MLQEYKAKTNIGVGIGILLQLLGVVMQKASPSVVLLGSVVILAGAVLLIWGLWNYSKGKGYHGAWGLLGLLGIFGLIALALFPDKNK